MIGLDMLNELRKFNDSHIASWYSSDQIGGAHE